MNQDCATKVTILDENFSYEISYGGWNFTSVTPAMRTVPPGAVFISEILLVL